MTTAARNADAEDPHSARAGLGREERKETMAVTGSPRDNQRPESEAGLQRMKTWFITGTSRGFGREWAIAALDRAQRFTAPGNPVATRDAILTLVDSDNPPLRMFLGESPLRITVEDYGSRLATWAQWQQVAAAAQGTQG